MNKKKSPTPLTGRRGPKKLKEIEKKRPKIKEKENMRQCVVVAENKSIKSADGYQKWSFWNTNCRNCQIEFIYGAGRFEIYSMSASGGCIKRTERE